MRENGQGKSTRSYRSNQITSIMKQNVTSKQNVYFILSTGFDRKINTLSLFNCLQYRPLQLNCTISRSNKFTVPEDINSRSKL